MDKFHWVHRDWADRSPEDVLRVTKEGLVKKRIQQFDRMPSIETLSQISEEHCKLRRRTMGDIEMRQRIDLSGISVPHRSFTASRPHSSYITNTRVGKIGSVQDLRYCPPSLSTNRRSSVCSPDHPHTRVNRADRFLKSRSYHESMNTIDLTSIRIQPVTQTENPSSNSPTNSPSLHRELILSKSLPLSQSPSIVVNVKKPSKSSDSSDKTPPVLLSPSPESTEKFTKRYISSPPPSKRRTYIELSQNMPSTCLLSPPSHHRLALSSDTPTVPESPTKLADRTLGNSLDDSSNDDVFGSPEHCTDSLSAFKRCPLSSADPAFSTDSQGSEDGVGREARENPLPSKSPVRKPSLLRRNRGMPNMERKKRTVTFTPEVLILQLCYEGKLKEIENIVQDHEFDPECINTLGPMGITAMHQCALDGNVECLQALVTAGGNVDVVDAEHCTPLHSAAINNHFSAIRFLLIAGADPTRVDDDNKTPYDIATVERVKKVLKMALQGSFLSSSSYPSDSKEKAGFQFDYTASDLSEGEDEITPHEPLGRTNSTEGSKGVSNIISYKRSSSTEDKPHQNREFMGIRLTTHKKEPVTQGTISEDDLSLTSSYSGYSGELSGLNSSCGNSDDSPCKSPMAFSTTALYSNSNSSVGTDLMERDNLAAYDIGSDLEPDSEDFQFQDAVACQDNAAVHKILKEFRGRIDVNKITRSDITALHHSVLEENYALAHTLVTEGRADVNIRDRDGWTPLHAASAVGSLKIAKFLVENGARTSLWNSSGEFAVDVAEDDAMKRYLHSIMLGPHAIKKRFPTMLT